MTYTETLDYLFTRLPMFSRQGASAYKADLNNTIRLCNALGNPQDKLKSIHIAGTNGKGSTSHMLAAIMQKAGYKTGLYTSPHLVDFRERIKIDGAMCSEAFVINFTERIKPLIEEIEPSFFEITVAMAFDYFANEAVDVAIIEVGLGGRLDSTNIIQPMLSIITNIGYDHMYLLGDTLEKIAFEKAGIIKANTTVIVGEFLPETKPVFDETATNKEAPIVYANQQRMVTDYYFDKDMINVQVANNHNDERDLYKLDLSGFYQTKNLLTVLEAINQLQQQEWSIEQKHVLEALQHVKKLTGLHGRWEIIHHQPMVVLDVAHNANGIDEITKQIEMMRFRHLHLVLGFVKDKDIPAVLAMLPKYAKYYFTRAAIERALPEHELAQQALAFELNGTCL